MNKSRFLKGFFRLSIVLFFVMLTINSVIFFKECHENMDFVLPHLSPRYAGNLFGEEYWCAIISRPEFLNKSIVERRKEADIFFSDHIEPFCAECLDVDKFRTKFIKSADLTLDEAPIEVWGNHGAITYRDISSYSWHEGLQFWGIVFNRGVMLVAAIETMVISVIMAGLVSLFIWVKKGFVPDDE